MADLRIGLIVAAVAACTNSTTMTNPITPPDGGSVTPDAPPGTPDAPPGTPDAPPGTPDAPPVAGVPDAPPVIPDAPPATADAPPPHTSGTWGPAEGLASAIYDVSTDDGGNIWAISIDTLYLLTPGATSFRAFTNADGLHVVPFIAPDGSSQITRLTAVAGAGPNEVYLGYLGYESSDPYSDTEEQKELGNGDRITYDPASGTIADLRYFFRCIVEVSRCWEDRSVRRIVVGHSGAAAGHAFFGFNHGATHVYNDVIGDHVHVEVNWVMGATVTTKYGEQHGLAVNDDGTVWIASRYGAGLMNWDPDPIAWVTAKFAVAFTTYTDDHGLDVPWGYTEDNRGAAVSGDGTLWLASDNHGLTSWNPSTPIASMVHWGTTGGLPDTGLVDVVADLDGTLWLVTDTHALLHFDPASAAVTVSPINDARRLYLDRRVSPRALYVARSSGVSLLP